MKKLEDSTLLLRAMELLTKDAKQCATGKVSQSNLKKVYSRIEDIPDLNAWIDENTVMVIKGGNNAKTTPKK